MSHVILWEFRVREGFERDFEATYARDGAWARLFGVSPEHRGTELLRDATTPRRYVTVDRWTSAGAFDAFHAAEYDALDARCEGWTEAETKLGARTSL